MSEETKPNTPDHDEAACKTALEFVDSELTLARKGRNTTRIVMAGFSIFVFAYMAILTSQINPFLEPDTLAEVGNGYALQYVDQYANQLVDMADKKTPEYMAMGVNMLQQRIGESAGIEMAQVDSASALSEQLIVQLPELRKAVEIELVHSLREQSEIYAKKFGEQVDLLITEDADEINEFFDSVNTPGAIEVFGYNLSTEIHEMLTLPGPDGESIKTKLLVSHHALQRISEHLERLANATDLTKHEQNQRRVIVIIAKTAEVSSRFE